MFLKSFVSISKLQLYQLPSKIKMDLQQSISSHNDVSVALAKHIFSTESKNTNLVFSPLSIHVVLGLIAAGSSGQTKDQLLSFLRSDSTDSLNSLHSQLVTLLFADGSSSSGPLLSFANGVWVDQSLTLKPSFKKVVEESYFAASSQVDFQTKPLEVTTEVNSWAEKGTNGLIKEILPPGSIDVTTRLIFANALYFKATWKEQFAASKTKDHEFHLLDGSSIQTLFMTSNRKQDISAYDGFKVLSLPYKQGDDQRQFSMYFFLPDAKDGLPALVDKLSSEPGFVERHLPHSKVAVGEFLIPKFKISFGFEASTLLKGLGVVHPFSGDGLTEMVDSPVSRNLQVSNIFHKSCIEVNEKGTEAAAATTSRILVKAIRVFKKLDFVADHPFLFLIRENRTGVVLFVGSVLNPAASQ